MESQNPKAIEGFESFLDQIHKPSLELDVDV